MDPQTRAGVLTEARTWIGTPYQHKSCVKGVGVDCGALLHAVYGQYRQLKPFPTSYAPDWTLHSDNEIYLDFIREYVIEVPTPVIGGIVLFKIGLCFGHGGIVSDGPGVIHAWGRTRFGFVQEKPWGFFRKFPERKYFDVVI